jgi:hypothetical protein
VEFPVPDTLRRTRHHFVEVDGLKIFYRRDIPGAVVRFLDTGHVALETHAAEIAETIRGFLAP